MNSSQRDSHIVLSSCSAHAHYINTHTTLDTNIIITSFGLSHRFFSPSRSQAKFQEFCKSKQISSDSKKQPNKTTRNMTVAQRVWSKRSAVDTWFYRRRGAPQALVQQSILKRASRQLHCNLLCLSTPRINQHQHHTVTTERFWA